MTSQQSPIAWIETQDGSRSRREIDIGGQLVGRAPDVDVHLASGVVSHHHAELYWDRQRLRVRDLGSRNGTEVNGDTVVDWVRLRDGDVISFADVRFVVRVGSAPDADEKAPQHPPAVAYQQPPPAQVVPRPSAVPIFVSHSSQDKRAARSVADALRRVGWTVWIDEAGIVGGKDWRGELVRALEETWVVVLLVCLQSMRSKWVIREVQAADRLGKQIIPVVLEETPYPDALRMILGGVQQIDLTRLHDEDGRGQLARLDDALMRAARQQAQTPPGTTQIAVGKAITFVGVIGILVGFALFVFLGFQAVDEAGPTGGPPTAPFLGWGIFAVSLVVAGVGEGVRRAGMRKGI